MIIKIWDWYVSILLWCIFTIDDKLNKPEIDDDGDLIRGKREKNSFRCFGSYFIGRLRLPKGKKTNGERIKDRRIQKRERGLIRSDQGI